MTEYEYNETEEVIILAEPGESYGLQRTLNIYIDESGNLDNKTSNSRYYIVGMVFHEGEEDDLYPELAKLEEEFSRLGYPNHCFHTGPLIHNKEEYEADSLETRRKLMRAFYAFYRHSGITHKEFVMEKKNLNKRELQSRLTKNIKQFLIDNLGYFTRFKEVKVCYDHGQQIVTNILTDAFRDTINKTQFVTVMPEESRLLQIADLLCTLRLLYLKVNDNYLSKKELTFFTNKRKLMRLYITPTNDNEIETNILQKKKQALTIAQPVLLCYKIIASKKGLAADAGADRGLDKTFAKTRGISSSFLLPRISHKTTFSISSSNDIKNVL